jgi:hypothetical protein
MIGRLMNHQAVVADRVEVTIARDFRRVDQDQAEGWWGEVWLSIETHVLPGDELTLQLSESVPSPIVVERVTVDSKAGRMLVRFRGSGPLES